MSEADTVKDLKVCLRDSHVAIMCACFGGAGSLLCVSRPAPGSSVAHPSDGFLAAPSKSEEARGHYPRARQPAHGIPARCPLCPASHTHPEETQCSLHTPAAPASCPHAALGTHQSPVGKRSPDLRVCRQHKEHLHTANRWQSSCKKPRRRFWPSAARTRPRLGRRGARLGHPTLLTLRRLPQSSCSHRKATVPERTMRWPRCKRNLPRKRK